MLKEGLTPKKYKSKSKTVETSFKKQLKHILGRPYLVVVIIVYGITFGLIAGSGALLTPLITSIGYDEVT